ncbi:MAG: tRNA guanosine(34) transglycosylase Tgt [bacterium]|nr:tRNA guanosine(34) transglycosylase Tgt [bacterium]
MIFRILKKSKISRARIGILKTSHGEVETPCLVPVATQAVIKTLTSEQVEQTKSQILICNTFHLHLKPGEGIVKSSGGLHKFMNWQSPLMTDSGGYQVFSLGFGRDFKMGKMLSKEESLSIKSGRQPKSLKITRDGVFFQSPLDGSKLFLGPKESIKIQEQLGADIIFNFDECPPPIADYEYTKRSMERTHLWAKICLDSRSTSSGQAEQALFGIVQGGKFKDLRMESAKFISSLPFDGLGIGGELGFDKKKMFQMLSWVTEILPEEKPRHLLGNGHINDLIKIFKSGIDTVDCVIPTHYARHGVAFVSLGRLDMAKSIFLKDSKEPLDKKCDCFVCQSYSKSYISHLFRAREITALSLLTFHNLYFFNTFIEGIREKIKQGKC